MFIKILRNSLAAIALVLLSQAAFAQDTLITKKEVVVRPDGSYTVFEYPVGREVMVNLLPSASTSGGKGTAKVIRAADGTRIFFDVAGLPATSTSYYAYAIDPSGVPSKLGPITVANGTAKGEFTTSLSQFMLVLSPMDNLTAVTPTTTVFISELPQGYALIPRRDAPAKVVQVAGTSQFYDVPMLNISAFGEDEKELTTEFGGALAGLKVEATVDREKGATKVRLTFEDMKSVPAGKRMIAWVRSPDGKFTKLGQVINTGRRDDTTISSETALTDFGLFITVEDTDVPNPTSKIYSAFRVTG